MTDNIAILAGYTREVWGAPPKRQPVPALLAPFLVRSDDPLDGPTRVWSMDAQCWQRLDAARFEWLRLEQLDQATEE